jgi:hypothetical protein
MAAAKQNRSKSPNGEDYRQRLNDKGRSGLLTWIDNWASPRIEAVNKKWKAKIKAHSKTQ